MECTDDLLRYMFIYLLVREKTEKNERKKDNPKIVMTRELKNIQEVSGLTLI